MSTLTLLQQCRTIAVVGLSPDEGRDSHRISRYMQAQGYRIIPINPRAQEILGETAYPDLTAAAAHHPIDLVNCFRRSEDIPPIAREAAAVGANRVRCRHLGVDDAGFVDFAADLSTGRVPGRPFLLFGQMTTADGTYTLSHPALPSRSPRSTSSMNPMAAPTVSWGPTGISTAANWRALLTRS